MLTGVNIIEKRFRQLLLLHYPINLVYARHMQVKDMSLPLYILSQYD